MQVFTGKNINFEIIPLDKIGKNNELLFHSNKRMFYELFFVSHGYFIKEYNLNSIRINRNEFHISLPGQVTSIKEISTDLTGFYCYFDNEFLEEIHMRYLLEKELAFINSFMYNYPLRLNDEISKRITYLFETSSAIQEETSREIPLNHAYLITIIYEIKKLIIECHLNYYPAKAFSIVRAYNDLLSKHIKNERTTKFYADQLNITTNHLNKSVKTITGKTAISLLNEMTILEAKIQLLHTHKPISEIAFELGYEDPSYFSRFFKKFAGLSPFKYRKLN